MIFCPTENDIIYMDKGVSDKRVFFIGAGASKSHSEGTFLHYLGNSSSLPFNYLGIQPSSNGFLCILAVDSGQTGKY